MKISDYAKIEQVKNLLLTSMESLGLKDQVKKMTEEDMDKLISLMAQLSVLLKSAEDPNKQVDFLVSYVIGLWTRLIVDYGVGMDKL